MAVKILPLLFAALATVPPASAQETLVKDIQPSDAAPDSSSSPGELTPFRDRLVFAATNEVLGREPWVSDGTEVGTRVLVDIHRGGSSSPHDFTELNNRLIFLAVDDGVQELWSTNGTQAGTLHLKDVTAGAGSETGPMTAGRDLAFFFVVDPAGNELWKSDGTTAGTVHVANVGTLDSNGDIVVYKEELYFTHAGAFEGSQGLWKSDGTEEGTVQVVSPWPGFGGEPRDFRVSGDYLFFTALTPEGRELWRTDGTSAGTFMLQDISTGSTSSDPKDLVALDDGTLLFSALSADLTNGLWRSDGTVGGTFQLQSPGEVRDTEGSIVALGDHAWFIVPQPGDDEIWTTDGTESGTSLRIADPAFTDGFRQVGSGDLVAFTGMDSTGSGLEPFISSGRMGGTQLIADVRVGAESSGAGGYTRVGGRMFFHADDGVTGNELHAFEISAYRGWVAEPFGSGCGTTSTASLWIDGRMLIGADFVFEVVDAVPGVPIAFVYSPGVTHLNVGPCDYYLPQAALVTLGTSDACGELSLTRTVPAAPGLIGSIVTIQALAVSSGGPFLGVGELSNPIEIVIGS